MMASVFLYGGCVIRDAYELARTSLDLGGYVARQSLISATNPPSKVPEQPLLKSGFQTRMLHGDLNSDLLTRLRRASRTTDLFVMDCHIERLGIQRLPDGTFITKSAELATSGLANRIPGISSEIRLGSERHMALYKIAAKRFAQRLSYMGMLEKTLVIDAPWALHDSDGVAFAKYKGKPVREMSDHISDLTAVLAANGLKVRRMPEEYSIAPTNHQWGRGPYHFGTEAMDWVAEVMKENLK